MKQKLYVLLPILFLLTGCISAYYVASIPVNYQNDVTDLNRIAKETAKNWDSLDPTCYENISYPVSVIHLNGEVRFQSSPDASISVVQALSLGYPILDVEQGTQIIGKVIISKDPGTVLLQYRRVTLSFLLFSSLLLAISCFLYFCYLKIKIIKPFQDLEQFAAEISKGNLHFSLKRRKNNHFGAFTESFDLMREQLMLAREREFQANLNQKELVASLSHDIKTPVTCIKLTSELLMELEQETHLKTKIKMIYQKTEQIEELVTNLFHTTLQDMEQLSVSSVETYSSTLKPLFQSADYKGKIKLSPIPDCMLLMDELRLSQIFSNIISNSYKYADTDITVSASLSDSHLILSIHDFGHSLSEDEIPLLCNKFYRGSNTSTKNGSGLGLYICKKLVEQMHGEIYCTCSTEGFTVILMLKLA